jgi:membrane protein implicated in regulation of membrane protease activity
VSLDSLTAFWVLVVIVGGVVEISIPHFGLIFVSIGAAAAALASLAGAGLAVQCVMFLAALGLSLGLLRRRMLARLGSRGVPSRVEPLLGRDGVVTHDIEASIGAGRVNVGGEDWAARSASPLPAGTRVRVVAADGIVLEVVPR